MKYPGDWFDEAPSKEAAIAVRQEAHGFLAYKVIDNGSLLAPAGRDHVIVPHNLLHSCLCFQPKNTKQKGWLFMRQVLDLQIQAAEQEWLQHWKSGPSRLRWNKIPLQVGDPAPDFELQDSTGVMVHLHEFWNHKPALLLFWRHYGCSCGFERAKRLQMEYAEYIKLGANVVLVGQGEPERAAAYAQINNIPCPVLCDPPYKVYQAFDVLEGKPSQIVFDAPDEFLQRNFEAGINLQKSRHGTERATVDNPWQLPGEFVVDQAGIIRLAYRYQYCEDWPNPLVLVGAIKEAIWENQ